MDTRFNQQPNEDWICENCGAHWDDVTEFVYCPKCGAKTTGFTNKEENAKEQEFLDGVDDRIDGGPA